MRWNGDALALLVMVAGFVQVTPYTAKLGVLFRLYGTRNNDLGQTWKAIALSAALAVEHINTRNTSIVLQANALLDPDFRVEYMALDTRSQPSIGVANAFTFLGEGTDVIIGSFRSAVNAPVALVSETQNVPVVAFGATSADLSDKNVYPTFSRTCPSDSMLAFALVQVSKATQWQRVGMLYFDDAYGRAFAQDVDTAAGEAGIDVVASQRFTSNEATIRHALEVLKQAKVRVIICVVFDSDVASVLFAAEEIGLTGEGYAWLTGDTLASPESVIALSPEHAARLRSLLMGWLKFVSLPLDPHPRYDSVWDTEEAHLSHPLIFERQNAPLTPTYRHTSVRSWLPPRRLPRELRCIVDSVAVTVGGSAVVKVVTLQVVRDPADPSLAGHCDVYCAYMYDAVWTASIAISRGRGQHASAVTGTELIREIRHLDFDGATGHVTFDTETGDRGLQGIKVEVLNFVPSADGQTLEQFRLYEWDAQDGLSVANNSAAPTWPGGRPGWEPPSDGRCQSGYVFSGETLACEPCPAGTEQEGENCVPCPPGTMASQAGQPCAECQEGYAPSEGMLQCLSCPTGSLRRPGSRGVEEEECLCEPGYFRPEGRVGPCFECPERAECVGKTSLPYPAEDTWGDPANPVEFFECKSQRCKGGPGFACDHGFAGIMCEGTEGGWFSFGSGVRIKCPASESNQILLHTALIIAVLLIFFTLNRLLASRFDSIDLFLDSMQRLAIVSNFRLRWPEQFAALFTILEIVLLDADLARPDCVMSWNFASSFWVQKMLLLLLFLLIWGPALVSSWQMKRRKDVTWRDVLTDDDHNAAAVNKAIHQCLDTVMMMYPTLAKNTLDTFTCRTLGEHSYLVADPNFQCGTSDHTTVVVISALLQPLLVFALPFGSLYWLMQGSRHQNLHVQRHLDRFGALYARYEPPYLWWEGWRTVQKLLLVAIQVLLWRFPLLQAMMALLLFLLSLASHYYAQPYANPVLDGMDSASYFVSCLFTMVGISFYSPDFFWRDGLYGLTLAGLAAYALVAVWCAYLNVREKVASGKAAEAVRQAAKKHSKKLHSEADRRSPEERERVFLKRSATAASLKQLLEEADEGLSELPDTLDGHVFKRWTDSEEVSLEAFHRLKKLDEWLAPYVSDQSPTSQFSMRPDAEFFRQVNAVFPNFFTWLHHASHEDVAHLRRLFQSIVENAAAPDKGFQAAIVPGDQSSVLYWLINVADAEARETLFAMLQTLLSAQPGRHLRSAADTESSWFATSLFGAKPVAPAPAITTQDTPEAGNGHVGSGGVPSCAAFASTLHPHTHAEEAESQVSPSRDGAATVVVSATSDLPQGGGNENEQEASRHRTVRSGSTGRSEAEGGGGGNGAGGDGGGTEGAGAVAGCAVSLPGQAEEEVTLQQRGMAS